MSPPPSRRSPARVLARAGLEIAFIVFLFYSNLLMGEFEASNRAGKTLGAALHDVCTKQNMLIGIVAAIIGFGLFEALRKRLQN